jgi:predicted N-acetyltransferase YhbS
MTIEYLADQPEALDIVVQWMHREWGNGPGGETLEERRTRFAGSMNRDRIPLAIVAVEAGEVLGSASLVAHDMKTRMELTPWLASVFVGEEYRRRGVGAELVRRIMAEAGKLKVPLLYLYTVHSERLYASLGWTVSERTNYLEHPVVIMTCMP